MHTTESSKTLARLFSELVEDEWDAIRKGLRDESNRWLEALKSPREVSDVEFTGMVSSIGHLA